MESQQKPPIISQSKQTRWIAFLPGFLISIAGSFAFAYFRDAAVPSARLAYGFIFGAVTFPIVFGVQLIFRLLLQNFLSRNATPKSRCLILELPAVLIAFTIGMFSYYHGRPTQLFRRLVSDSIPPSIQNLQVEGYNSVGEQHWVFCFDIESHDLQKLIRQRGFVLISDTRNVIFWEETVRNVGLTFELQPPFSTYVVGTNGTKKYLLTNTNLSKVYLIHVL